MTRIVRSTCRYKRPPGKRKPVTLEVPENVTIRDKTQRRVPAESTPPTEAEVAPPPANEDGSKLSEAEASPKSAIVTIRRRHGRYAPDLTEEESKPAR